MRFLVGLPRKTQISLFVVIITIFVGSFLLLQNVFHADELGSITISGKIFEQDNITVLPGVTITVKSDTTTLGGDAAMPITTQTGANGTYVLALPDSSYNYISISRNDYQTMEGSIVNAGGLPTATVDIAMKPGSGKEDIQLTTINKKSVLGGPTKFGLSIQPVDDSPGSTNQTNSDKFSGYDLATGSNATYSTVSTGFSQSQGKLPLTFKKAGAAYSPETDKYYVVGGVDGSNQSNRKIYEYDRNSSTDAKSVVNLPDDFVNPAAIYVSELQAILIFDSKTTNNQAWFFQPQSDYQFKSLGNIAPSDRSQVVQVKSNLYLVSESTGTTSLTMMPIPEDTDILTGCNPSCIKPLPGPNIPNLTDSTAYYSAIQNKIYLFGGKENGQVSNQVYEVVPGGMPANLSALKSPYPMANAYIHKVKGTDRLCLYGGITTGDVPITDKRLVLEDVTTPGTAIHFDAAESITLPESFINSPSVEDSSNRSFIFANKIYQTTNNLTLNLGQEYSVESPIDQTILFRGTVKSDPFSIAVKTPLNQAIWFANPFNETILASGVSVQYQDRTYSLKEAADAGLISSDILMANYPGQKQLNLSNLNVPFKPGDYLSLTPKKADLKIIVNKVYANKTKVSGLTTNSTSIGRYEKFEATFDINRLSIPNHNLNDEIAAGTINPYWPYDPNPVSNAEHPNAVPVGKGISVDGLFLPPEQTDWSKALVQPGFWYQDYQIDAVEEPNDHTIADHQHPKDTPLQWKIRFAPTTIGNDWQYKIRITDRTGTTFSPIEKFNTIASTNHGFAKVSSTDPRYFETSDGTFLPIVGVNNEGDFKKTFPNTYKDGGINLVRTWWQSSNPSMALFGASGQGGAVIWGGQQFSTDYLESDNIVNIKCNSVSCPRTTLTLKPFQSYHATARIKTVDMSGNAGQGVRLQTYNSIYIWNQTEYNSAVISNTTNGWQDLTLDFRTDAAGKFYLSLIMNDANPNSSAYVSSISVKENLSGGKLGPEMAPYFDFQFQKSYPQHIAWRIDQELELAKQNGIYLKAVLEEKQDNFFGSIKDDGTWGTATDGIYANDHSASRVYQTYYWRYIIARYGSSTALHSVEFCNECDPFNGNSRSAALAFANFFHNNSYRYILSTTSFWHSIPGDFWKDPALDYVGVHEYTGPTNSSHGLRELAWNDGDWPYDPNYNIWYPGPGQTDPGVYTAFDPTQHHSGNNSLQLVGSPVPNHPDWTLYNTWGGYNVGINPSHTYTVKYWAKTQNVGNADGQWPGVLVTWAKSYQNDVIGGERPLTPANIPDTGGEWKEFQRTLTPPLDANETYIQFQITRKPTGDSTVWIDDVQFIDNTTGENLFVDGSFEGGRMDYNTALLGQRYNTLFDAFSDNIRKPVMWAETGINGPEIYGTTYKGFSYTGENQQLIDDTEGIWLKDLVWTQLMPGSENMLYWWTDVIQGNGLYKYYKAFSNFLAGIPLSNGKYTNTLATTSDANLTALGQKEVQSDGKANKAHLWINNKNYTWKAVVDHNFNIDNIKWNAAVRYNVGSISTSGGNFYKSIKDNDGDPNINHATGDTNWWSPITQAQALDLLDMTSLNPPLPAPVSGTVTIPNMNNISYKIEWWDTSTGTRTSTQNITASNNKLTLTVSNLPSDIAVKIYPAGVGSAPSTPTVSSTVQKSSNSETTVSLTTDAVTPATAANIIPTATIEYGVRKNSYTNQVPATRENTVYSAKLTQLKPATYYYRIAFTDPATGAKVYSEDKTFKQGNWFLRLINDFVTGIRFRFGI